MASIRKRGSKWQAQVRRKGRTPMARSFLRKADAVLWANRVALELEERDAGRDAAVLKNLRLIDLLERYRAEVLPRKRAEPVEAAILKAFMRTSLATLSLDQLTLSAFARYRDRRLTRVKPVTVNRELGIIQHCLTTAREEWGVPLKVNPLTRLRRPKQSGRRERRLRPGEYERLTESAGRSRNSLMKPLVMFAVETGMRQGELLRAEWRHLDAAERTLAVPITKNGQPRVVPLTPMAVSILRGLHPGAEGRIFPSTASAVKQAWRRLVARAGLDDLHFHDLRHEAISRFLERGLTISEVAWISGHKDHRMLLRYAHAQPCAIGRKLSLFVQQE